MRALIDRMLELAGLENQTALQNPEACELSAICQRAVDAQASAALAKSARVTLGGETPAPVRGDPFLLERAVSNLLSNAVRHTEEGSEVCISLGPAPARTDGQARVQVVIDDHGPGIPDFAMARVFERFYSDKSSGGHGLGLAFVQQIARLHGGVVRLANRPDGGARATLLLALGASD